MTEASGNVFELATSLLRDTGRNIFITGKAGTGKTTFLKQIRQTVKKKMVITAPTGVAAMNAGGVTLHSFFQLPVTPYIPNANTTGGINRQQFFRNLRMTKAKKDLIQELELLVIDEVSMVRADVMDLIDAILRHFRPEYPAPFGGVQVLLIGDLFQLPPVAQYAEWELLKQVYKTPYFFDSLVIKDSPPLYIELKEIFRQQDQVFIRILNNIRNNIASHDDLMHLNQRFDPGFRPPDEEHYITLTTHNAKADRINSKKLQELPGSVQSFAAKIDGEFPDHMFPADNNLLLKKGAQVMFIKNEAGINRRFYNGMLGVVKHILGDEIFITPASGGDDIKLERETWKNLKFSYDKEHGEVTEEELGSFNQFPIRLAWAVTIHKSQGLTFERAIIDAGESFTSGQVYVALSRCTNLEGMILYSRITPSSIRVDPAIVAYGQAESDPSFLQIVLQAEKSKYQQGQVVRAFQFQRMIQLAKDFVDLVQESSLPDKEETLNSALAVRSEIFNAFDVGIKFTKQLNELFAAGDVERSLQRIEKGVEYFGNLLGEKILKPVRDHYNKISQASKVKKYRAGLLDIFLGLKEVADRINHLRIYDVEIKPFPLPSIEGTVIRTKTSMNEAGVPSTIKTKSPRPEKGSSQRETFALFRQGKSVSEISSIRNLSPGTIESHLADLINWGELSIEEVIPPSKIPALLERLGNVESSMTAHKESLGDEYSFNDIRIGLFHLRRKKEKPV